MADDSCAVRNLTREEKRQDFERDPVKASSVRKNLRQDLLRISQQFFDGEQDFEEGVRDVWDELIHTACILPPDSPEIDRLVTLILEIRELGPLIRTGDDGGEQPAVMPNGQQLWSDLPYLFDEVCQSWAADASVLALEKRASLPDSGRDSPSAIRRARLAALTAKLCAVGVLPEALSGCALWLFRDALETDEADEARLLPACFEFLSNAHLTLAKMCASNHQPPAHEKQDGHLGSLAVRAGVEQPGFNIQRWLFWRRRFGELYLGDVAGVASTARKCFEIMVDTGLALGIDIPGERKYMERVFEALDKEVAALDYAVCVAADNIRIDPAWAEN
ncbi:hypothetical protein L249_0947 [Ophiocordyceps polyrhachis-furcata BCC 54312]|uniref:Uncharacterized protein n=1 Tax=Ophiocordyceps polyrhachis-furcata BCC 54312 TaxID=1330021 RepID=A0A367LCF7_9HYPO|nr:hypothetical protein L249_0947 [Ophiocordyceps polyrhachis-furcata BCC 54312]